MARIVIVVAWLLGLFTADCIAATLMGRDVPLKSGGAASPMGGWTLSQNGYLGAYVRVDKPGDVTVTIRAGGEKSPHMNIVVADAKVALDVADDARDYVHTFSLPAGTYFLRVELTNHSAKNDCRLNVLSIDVSSAAHVLKENTDALALAVADSYIRNFRRGEVSVSIPASIAPPGASVRVKLRRHAFNFGGTIHGENNLNLLTPDPPPDSDAAKYQQFVNSHFNLLVASNGGKWLYNEGERGNVTMQFVDACLAYAKAHNMRAREHALLWDSAAQQPKWVNALLEAALDDSDPARAADAKKQLREAIHQRIEYYVRDRAANYIELDALNEPYHQPRYWKVFGADGLADIFAETSRAARTAGAPARLYLNEYNVFQWSSNPLVKGAPLDPYANWYRELFEAVREAGGPIDGVGIQYYAIKGEPGADKNNPHSSARITAVLQNLSVLGLPISLCEFGVQRRATPEQAADILEDTMRLVFGTDQCTTFIIWGFWGGSMWDMAPMAALIDEQWNLTPAGKRYGKLMGQWSTDVTTSVGAGGTIRFNGFWGDYDVSIGPRTLPLTTSKDQAEYTLLIH